MRGAGDVYAGTAEGAGLRRAVPLLFSVEALRAPAKLLLPALNVKWFAAAIAGVDATGLGLL